jgi:hypothetical protein
MPGLNGFIIFAIGIVIAIMGAAKVPAEGSDWPDTLVLFSVGSVIAIIGLSLWRMAVNKANAEEADADDNKDPATLLADLMIPLQKFAEDISELDTENVTKRVDDLLDNYVLPFAEVRHRIINKLGMDKGAEILVVVAYGERMLNRVWSAAADGHLPEANSCLPEAVEAFVEAQKLIEA